MNYCIDASSFIHLWNEAYPQKIFPSLYQKLKEISPKIILISPMREEIKKEAELLEWLKSMDVTAQKMIQKHKIKSLELSGKYEINPNSNGVSQRDIELIAYAMIEKHTVVTEEAPPKEPAWRII